MKKLSTLLIPVLICFLIGATASLFQTDSIQTWYPTLNKPMLTPPNIVFPIAWSIIYVCMGLSIGLIILSDIKEKRKLGMLFVVQLLFNFAWSFLFFYLKNPLLGLIDILILDILVTLYFIVCYSKIKKSALLFLPYIFWIYFATYLNGYILFYN